MDSADADERSAQEEKASPCSDIVPADFENTKERNAQGADVETAESYDAAGGNVQEEKAEDENAICSNVGGSDDGEETPDARDDGSSPSEAGDGEARAGVSIPLAATSNVSESNQTSYTDDGAQQRGSRGSRDFESSFDKDDEDALHSSLGRSLSGQISASESTGAASAILGALMQDASEIQAEASLANEDVNQDPS